MVAAVTFPGVPRSWRLAPETRGSSAVGPGPTRCFWADGILLTCRAVRELTFELIEKRQFGIRKRIRVDVVGEGVRGAGAQCDLPSPRDCCRGKMSVGEFAVPRDGEEARRLSGDIGACFVAGRRRLGALSVGAALRAKCHGADWRGGDALHDAVKYSQRLLIFKSRRATFLRDALSWRRTLSLDLGDVSS